MIAIFLRIPFPPIDVLITDETMTTDISVRMPEINGHGDENYEDGIYDEYDDNSSSRLFERQRIKALADERELVQKKTFTKWVNSHLIRVNCKIQDLYADMRDGKMLIKLLQVLSGERLPKPTRGKMRIHCLENVDKGLQFLRDQHVHLENLGSHDIVDGNSRLTLGLIWTIILRFQIQDITFEDVDNQETRSAKEALLLWCQMKTAGYKNVNVKNFTTSWRDGLAFNALIHKHRPELIEYDRLQKSNAIFNLRNAFETAENHLGLMKFLDPEDVNVEQPDEKSIITYVVTFYHYFNKIKQETIQGKRIGKVVAELMENESMMDRYEQLSSDLLEWIRLKILDLNNRNFENSLSGVQRQLTDFNNYRTQEKPPRFNEKGELEVLLFTLQSRMRANNQRPFLPREGKTIAEINKSWEQLEKAEHERELALKQELIRQEKLEQLAARFDRKAKMRQDWLTENQRLVAQDNFGNDLASVEAARKKHEAIETDIYAYEERVQAVVAVAAELEAENYNDYPRINESRDLIIGLWNDLVELLKSRRARLEQNHQLQKIFSEMLDILDQCKEIETKLVSEERGQHLQDVDFLLQKHALTMSDLNVINDRIQAANSAADPFARDRADPNEYRPAEPEVVREHQQQLLDRLNELRDLAAKRNRDLEDNRQLCQFWADLSDLENNFREQEQVLALTNTGRDVPSVKRLIAEHKNAENNLESLGRALDSLDDQGRELANANIPGAENIEPHLAETRAYFDRLNELAAARRKNLEGGLEYFLFFNQADELDGYLLDTLRVVSSDDVGRDEGSVQALIKKHEGVKDELDSFEKHIVQLQSTVETLPEEARAHPDIIQRLSQTEKRKQDLIELSNLRKQRLVDALSLYKLLSDADAIEAWIDEKGKLLATLIPGNDLEEVEIMKHRFGTLENDLQNQEHKLNTVNGLGRRLLTVDHPNADEILQRQNTLNARWAQLRDMVDQKRAELDRAHRLETFRIDCQETVTWIEDKTRILEDSGELTNDLSGVMKLQRRLSMMERDLKAIGTKLDTLKAEADEIAVEKPHQAMVIHEDIKRIQHVWDVLNRKVREHEAKLDEAGDLQRFLRDLDHFQAWLSATQRQVASEDEPQSLADAERLLEQHATIHDEINGYAEDYRKMRAMGDRVTQDQTDPQYMFLRQRLAGLEEGWEELGRMWENRQHMLSQGLNLQMFLRDAKQAEVMLSQQDNFLAKDDQPTSLEQAENLQKRHLDFITTMVANDDKICTVVAFGDKLCDDGHYAADKIHKKARNIQERRDANREKANAQLDKLKEAVGLHQFLSDCEELREWIEEKMIRAQDETYRDARSITQKFTRHEAFKSELSANKQRLQELQHAAERLSEEKPEFLEFIDPQVEELATQWEQLEKTTEEKGQKLFDANRQQLYIQSVNDMKDWAQQLEQQIGGVVAPSDLTTVNEAIQRQQEFEEQMSGKVQHLESLQGMEPRLEEMYPDELEDIRAHRIAVTEQLQRLKAPLDDRRRHLERRKAAFQFVRDVEDEKLWVDERMPLANAPQLGENLFDCNRLQKNTQSLRNEIDNHEPWINRIAENGRELIDEGHENSERFQQLIDELYAKWNELKQALDDRKARLAESEKAHKFLYDCNEAEAWMSEQELYMLQDERGKDEFSTQNQIKKHERLQADIDNFAKTITELAARARRFIDERSPLSEQISVRQGQIEKLYAGLQDLCKDRRKRLDETLQLYGLHREIDDLLQWIADKEVVAGSNENGQDYEHVQMLQERFKQFAQDTYAIGSERVANANDDCDELIAEQHTDAPTIATWKDSLNEAWENLTELIDTRSQALESSRQEHKFYHDCRDCLARIIEKKHAMPDELGRDLSSVSALSRKHQNFLKDVEAIGAQVAQIERDAAMLRHRYAGDRAMEIVTREAEVLREWKQLHGLCEARLTRLTDTSDLFKFMNMVRDLLLWMDEVKREMTSHERPRDVSGVELLMNNHQSLKAEIDTREENFHACITLGRQLLDRRHYASSEIEKKLIKLTTERAEMMHRWEDRWEYLRLILEVYQFARDAAVADAWLSAQDPYLRSRNYGRNLEEVIALIKQHEAFEKSASAQDERFLALEKLTNFELKEMQRREQYSEEDRRRRAGQSPPHHTRPGRSGETTFPVSEPGRSEAGSRYYQHQPFDLTISSLGSGGSGTMRGERARIHSEPSSWRQSLSRTARFAGHDLRGARVGDQYEGTLIRKHTFEALDRRASNRAWDKLYTVLQGTELYFFKDARHRQDNQTFHNEPPIQLSGCTVQPSEYTKRKNVISLRLPFGSEYLLQCADEDDMAKWLTQLQTATGRMVPIAQSSPAPPQGTSTPIQETAELAGQSPPEPPPKAKKGGFFSKSRKS
ncbi:Spectrin beta chain [Aphelenchoides besseyi]|nr:Spectrin beta chain [Aphelenchoides besseyi]